MREDLEALLILQDRDQKIRALTLQQKTLPAERKSLENRLSGARLLVDEARQRVRENEVERRKLELDVEGKQTAINRFKTQQQQTRKNDEFQALSNEIKHFESDIQALEDRELELMEQGEQLQSVASAAENDLKKTEAIIREQLARLEAGVAAADARLGELRADHARLSGSIPADTVELYQRLFAKKGDAAVVPLDHEICGGCHMKVPTQTAADIRGDKLVQCPQCGRILYRVL